MRFYNEIKRSWGWYLINAIGLGAAIACVVIVVLYSRQQLSYDRFHSKADLIYRITLETGTGSTSMHPARVVGDIPSKLLAEYPSIEKMVRLVPFRKAIISIGDNKFYSQNAFSTDSTFFDIFDFKVISGDPHKALRQPLKAFISKSLSVKYFGTTDVIGKTITITHQQETEPLIFTIEGVMDDFPANSHLHADLLTSLTEIDSQSTWAYTYFLMKKGTDVPALRNSIQKKWEKEDKSSDRVPVVYFQKLTDIHLYSHLTREMEKNGDIKSLLLMNSGAFIIFIIALINFRNLSKVRFIADLKSVRVKLINGASKKTIAGEILNRMAPLLAVSVIIALFADYELDSALGLNVLNKSALIAIICVVTGFAILIGAVSLMPLFSTDIVSYKKCSGKNDFYTAPLIAQFTLAIMTMVGTFVLNRQMTFIGSQHPDSKDADMIVIPDNTWEAVQRFPLLKKELQKETSVKDVTAAMEEPGGDILDACSFEMEGLENNEAKSLNIFTIDPDFFKAMGITPLAGTATTENTPDSQWESDAIELSNLRQAKNGSDYNDKGLKEKMAEYEKKVSGYREKYILNQSALKLIGIKDPKDAVGKRFRLNFFLPDLFPQGEVAGVVPDFHYTNLHSEEKPLVIVPRKIFNYCFLIKLNHENKNEAINTIKSCWSKINPEFPLQYEYITDSYHKIYSDEYSQTKAVSLFALLSLIISMLGIYAMSSFSLQRRIKEIGVRKVNGARVKDILSMLNQNSIRMVTIAFIVAVPVSYLIMKRWLQSFAYSTGLSWWIFALAGIFTLLIAIVTVLHQSLRAATKNPVEALRYE